MISLAYRASLTGGLLFEAGFCLASGKTLLGIIALVYGISAILVMVLQDNEERGR